jgi:hypothetical protein
MDKDALISKVYYDPAGYGSVATTYKDAKKRDASITLSDVKEWFGKNVERRIGYRGFNSYINEKPFQQFQADLFFFNEPDIEYKIGLILVDTFSKFCQVIPLKTKQPADVLQGFKDGFEKMKGKPESVYSDNEGAFVSNEVQKYFKDEGIRHLTTLTHAPVAERTIRTIKDMIYKRMERDKKPWYDLLFTVLTTYNFKMQHKSTKMTPADARQGINTVAVKMNLERLRVTNRKYPQLQVGDSVKYYKKKDKLDKERVGVWSKSAYEVLEIVHDRGQTFYKTTAPHHKKLYLRHELLKV